MTTPADRFARGVGLDDALLDAKLSVPAPAPGLLSRASLTDAARETGAVAVGVTTPAGYGKSTLLREWAHREHRRVGWLSLDGLDDDANRLLFLLASVFEHAAPEQAGLAATTSRSAARLAAAFRRAADPFVLLLDDLHELRSPECHDVLRVVLDAVPAGSQVVSASRHAQPHLPRLRAAGAAIELTTADLRLDATDAEHIFATAGTHLTPEQAREVTARTEGWPVGLHLAALVARDDQGSPEAVTGDDRFIADYLHHEVFRDLDPATQRFLRRTAVLDRLHGPLCDAVLEEQGAQDRLRTLETSSSFLVPLDRTRGWYRYHSLFREFLLAELSRVEPEVTEKLHLRAADWFESHGAPERAVECLLATSDLHRCAQLVTELALTTSGAGGVSTVQRWLSALGDSVIEAHPPLAVMAGWVAASVGDTAQAQRWAARASDVPDSLAPRSMLRAAMCPAGPEQMRADGELAAAAARERWGPWRAAALCVLAEAHLLGGARASAAELFEDASTEALYAGSADSVVLSESSLAVLSMDACRWHEAAVHVDLALGAIARHQLEDYAVSLLAFAAAARLAVHRGDLAQADERLGHAMRARAASTVVMPCLATRARVQLAKVCWARGAHADARQLLSDIDTVLRRRPALGVLVQEVTELRAILAQGARTAPYETPLTAAELRVLPYLATHLKIAEIGARLRISRNTVASEVSAIYRKLGVTSRGEAVERATLLGLLGG